MPEAAAIVVSMIVGYLLGSIPVGLVVGKLAKGIDLRQHGSGKTGATNVLRTLGAKYTILVILCDAGKGAAAVAISLALADSDGAEAAAGLAALFGHVWPIFAGFRGGRGVITGLSAFFVVQPVVSAVALGIGLIVIVPTRYVSAGSILGALSILLFAIGLRVVDKLSIEHTIWALLGSVFVIYQHRDNIIRLLKGTERKLGQRAAEPLTLQQSRGKP